jgi:hypothetical protein
MTRPETDMNSSSQKNDPVRLLANRRTHFEDAMARYLAGSPEIDPSAEDRDAATLLAGALIASLHDTDRAGAALAVGTVAQPYFARFGDGLSPILKDILGSEAPPSFLSRSIDSYWRAVRAQHA